MLLKDEVRWMFIKQRNTRKGLVKTALLAQLCTLGSGCKDDVWIHGGFEDVECMWVCCTGHLA